MTAAQRPPQDMLRLYIGNKNYSSWSMRPWVLMRQAGIAFDEVPLRFDSFAPDSDFKRQLAGISPTGQVPVLVDGDLVVWDTLAIAEYLAEKFPDLKLWPVAPQDRARARSACAEMHSGFAALRSACGMNIEADLPDVGAIHWRDRADVRRDVDRLTTMWQELLAISGGPMLFGDFGIADAFFAPTVTRFRTYHLPAPAGVSAWMERLRALPGVRAWTGAACAEHDFLSFEEPYRAHPPVWR